MIDHIGIAVSDYARSVRFYREALAPLGYELSLEVAGWAGFGVGGKPDFWIAEQPNVTPTHVAFSASDRATVRAFHEAALRAGGKQNGAPGPRPEYHPDYYGAFVLDPDGHNVEAVCRAPEA